MWEKRAQRSRIEPPTSNHARGRGFNKDLQAEDPNLYPPVDFLAKDWVKIEQGLVRNEDIE